MLIVSAIYILTEMYFNFIYINILVVFLLILFISCNAIFCSFQHTGYVDLNKIYNFFFCFCHKKNFLKYKYNA